MLVRRVVGLRLFIVAIGLVALQIALPQQVRKAASPAKSATPKGAQTVPAALPPLIEVVSYESALATLNGITTVNQASVGKVELRTPDAVVAGLPPWLSKKAEEPKDAKQRKYVAQYRAAAERLISGFDYHVRFFGGEDFPVRFAMREGSLSVLVTGVFYTKMSNTLRTTESTRAAMVFREIIAPQLAVFEKAFGGSGVKFYGMLVTYGSQDFSEEHGAEKVESVIVIVPAEKCKQFAEARITDAELISAGDTYLPDRKMKSGVKKIKILLD